MVLARRSVEAPNNTLLNSSDSSPKFISRRASLVRRCSQPNSLGDAVKHQRFSQSGNLSQKLFSRLSINQCPWAYHRYQITFKTSRSNGMSPHSGFMGFTAISISFHLTLQQYTRPDLISITWFWWSSQGPIQNLSHHFESSGEHDLSPRHTAYGIVLASCSEIYPQN